MSTADDDLLARLRQPEYTGENRCLPCTTVNGVLAALAAAGLWLVHPAVAVAFAGLAAGAIYLRGYLVPGTPELTKRYLPDRVLRWFDKAPAPPEPGETTDVEAYLLDHDAIRPTADDLAVTDGFRRDWQAGTDAAQDDLADAAGDLLGLASPGVEDRSDRFVVTEDGYPAADWPSRAALLADLGAVDALADRDPTWEQRDPTEQGRILAGLRIFLETCPDCGGEPALGEETVESCCHQAEVFTYTCTDCGARLLEVEQ